MFTLFLIMLKGTIYIELFVLVWFSSVWLVCSFVYALCGFRDLLFSNL